MRVEILSTIVQFHYAYILLVITQRFTVPGNKLLPDRH